tara:strand:+ start:627 stop:1403 length:777 start_codon:yes stop_codon:yes gene_type:complete
MELRNTGKLTEEEQIWFLRETVCWLKEIGEQFNDDELSPEFQKALVTPNYKITLDIPALREQVREGLFNLRKILTGDSEIFFEYEMNNSSLIHIQPTLSQYCATDEIDGNFDRMGDAIAAAQDSTTPNWVAEAGFYLMATWKAEDVTNEKSQFPEDDPNPFIFSPPEWLVLAYYDGDTVRTANGTDSWLVSVVNLDDDDHYHFSDPFIESGWAYSAWEPVQHGRRDSSVSKIYYLGASCSERVFKKDFYKTGIINWVG